MKSDGNTFWTNKPSSSHVSSSGFLVIMHALDFHILFKCES